MHPSILYLVCARKGFCGTVYTTWLSGLRRQQFQLFIHVLSYVYERSLDLSTHAAHGSRLFAWKIWTGMSRLLDIFCVVQGGDPQRAG